MEEQNLSPDFDRVVFAKELFRTKGELLFTGFDNDRRVVILRTGLGKDYDEYEY